MLIRFGFSSPVADLRMRRTRQADGRGMLPAPLTLTGYAAAMRSSLVGACTGFELAPIFRLDVLNAGSIAVDLALQWNFGRGRAVTLGIVHWLESQSGEFGPLCQSAERAAVLGAVWMDGKTLSRLSAVPDGFSRGVEPLIGPLRQFLQEQGLKESAHLLAAACEFGTRP